VDVNGGWEGFGGVSLLTIFLYLFDALLRSTLRLHRYRSRRSCAMLGHESRLIPMTLLRGFRLVPTDSSSKKLYQMPQDYNGFRDFEALDSFTKASVGTGWDDWRDFHPKGDRTSEPNSGHSQSIFFSNWYFGPWTKVGNLPRFEAAQHPFAPKLFESHFPVPNGLPHLPHALVQE